MQKIIKDGAFTETTVGKLSSRQTNKQTNDATSTLSIS